MFLLHQHVFLAFLGWFARREVNGYTTAVLWGAASRICSKQYNYLSYERKHIYIYIYIYTHTHTAAKMIFNFNFSYFHFQSSTQISGWVHLHKKYVSFIFIVLQILASCVCVYIYIIRVSNLEICREVTYLYQHFYAWIAQ